MECCEGFYPDGNTDLFPPTASGLRLRAWSSLSFSGFGVSGNIPDEFEGFISMSVRRVGF